MTKLNIVSGYTYASPRYHTTKFASSIYADDDYQLYDVLNGTYDVYWPLYAVTESDKPSSVLINSLGDEVEVSGDLELFLLKDNYASRTIGSVGYSHPIVNTNLETREVSFSIWLQPKLNPGWSSIQTYGDTAANHAGFILRILSSAEIIKGCHAVKIEKKEGDVSTIASSTPFPKGIILDYQDKIYRCINPNNKYPSVSDPDWLNLDASTNIFHADFYVYTADGQTAYFDSFADASRRFTPKENDEDLVSWNLSAWYE